VTLAEEPSLQIIVFGLENTAGASRLLHEPHSSHMLLLGVPTDQGNRYVGRIARGIYEVAIEVGSSERLSGATVLLLDHDDLTTLVVLRRVDLDVKATRIDESVLTRRTTSEKSHFLEVDSEPPRRLSLIPFDTMRLREEGDGTRGKASKIEFSGNEDRFFAQDNGTVCQETLNSKEEPALNGVAATKRIVGMTLECRADPTAGGGVSDMCTLVSCTWNILG
jgi:hypothetical protein